MAAATRAFMVRCGRITRITSDFVTLRFLMFGAPVEPATMCLNTFGNLRIMAVMAPIT